MFAIVVVASVFLGFFAGVTYQKLLDAPSGDLLHEMPSASMEPTINVGDLLVIKNTTDASEINAGTYGDLIAFNKPKSTTDSEDVLIVHRAIDKVTQNGVTYFKTKGDANAGFDMWSPDYRGEEYSLGGMISEKLLIGKVIDTIPSSVSFEDSVPYPPSQNICASA